MPTPSPSTPLAFSMRSWFSALSKAVGKSLGGRPITYRLFVNSGSLNTLNGTIEPSYHDVYVTVGFPRAVSDNEVGASNNKIELSDTVYTIPWNDMRDHLAFAKARRMTEADEILDEAGAKYRVIAVSLAAGGAHFEVTARLRSLA